MADILTEDDIQAILNARGPRYFIGSNIEIGESVEVVFKDVIKKVTQGSEDLLGRTWDHEWAKFEAEAEVNKMPVIFSFGGTNSSLLASFIVALKQNNIDRKSVV